MTEGELNRKRQRKAARRRHVRAFGSVRERWLEAARATPDFKPTVFSSQPFVETAPLTGPPPAAKWVHPIVVLAARAVSLESVARARTMQMFGKRSGKRAG